ncbi:endonuclease/exonuclease/phosphatase family protein [Donghicola tyrosinivorans]|uniref:Endonuclease/exonuclease/phosphatase (EEP) superfamily protein YafD n=1 Tax=Donghicola tyrosinivorans TaxID=1652492 RepID=A0A2T0WRM5_9RHOB|nr:endonuclease/exonuclease/phosphatase family protein [Donghicola tyrosinivorans]PRY89327.1 endonuclease/exonuclease/phosphatase (EEP) superfamily protein YafD [Donghicola tyrosinivorans]
MKRMYSTSLAYRVFIGAPLLLFACAAMLAAGLALYVQDESVTGTFARMADSLAPHLYVVGILSFLLSWVFLRGTPIKMIALALGGLSFVLATVSGVWTALDNHKMTIAVDSSLATDITVLWFNVYEGNQVSPNLLASEVRDSGADVVFLGESTPIKSVLPDLQATYPHQMGCAEWSCQITVLSKLPFGEGSKLRATTRPDRLATLVLETGSGKPVTVFASHLAKPWFYGYVNHDIWFVNKALNAAVTPYILVGDFNSAPWSSVMMGLRREHGLSNANNTPKTWPVGAPSIGVPIDGMYVSGGVAITSITPWGAHLQSNHLGLLGTFHVSQ